MNKKRNVSYIKPEDPEFLKVLKRQAGYDEKNHKFDELQNAEDDFADDGDSEQPQIVVLKDGDLTAEEVELEKKRIEKEENETKADLNERVIFKPKEKSSEISNKRKKGPDFKITAKQKKSRPLLSFNDDNEDDNDEEESDNDR